MADETIHPRPDQAEEPVDDVGASNVDLDESRHGPGHESPADPEPGHDPDAHGADHDDHHGDSEDDHDDGHSVEDPKWVLAPLLVGLVLGIIVIIVLGVASDASPFHQL